MKLGWIGTGNMGVRMAERLAKAGYSLYVYNRTPEKTQRVLDTGNARRLDSPAEIARECDIIFTSLTNDVAMRSVLEGENGLLSKVRPGQILVEMSTFSPDFCNELRQTLHKRNMLYLDAPVIGSMFMIEAGLLKILASGDEEAYNTVLPYFEAIGKTSIYMGTGAKARYMKIAVNMMICSYLTIYGEILSAGEGMGFAWEELNDILEKSAGSSAMLFDKGTCHRERVFSSPTALTSTAFKDLSLALSCAGKAGFALPLTSVICQYDRFMHFNPKYETYSTFGTIGVLEDICGRLPGDYPQITDEERPVKAAALSGALTAVTTLLAGEAVLFCKRADIDRSIAIECLGTCHGASDYFKGLYRSVIEGEAADTITIEECRIDLSEVLKSAMNAGQFVPIMAIASQQLNIMAADHGGDAGLCEILK